MEIMQIPVGRMGNLAYIVFNPQDRSAAIIDASWEPETLIEALNAKGLALRAVLLTHGHFDHTNAVPAILKAFPNVSIYMRQEDKMLPEEPFAFKNPVDMNPIAEFPEIEMLQTPGHTGGSVCWILPGKNGNDGIIYTGDTLFAGACGRIDFPESVPDRLYSSFKLFEKLPGGMTVYPGHSYNAAKSTIEQERRSNPYMRAAAELPEDGFLGMLL